MLNGWYYNRKNGQRLLSVRTIAADCGCGVDTVKEWFTGKIVHSAQTDGDGVDAGEVVAFLVRNSMPVYSSLLPPKSRKILFITMDRGIPRQQRYIDLILSYFKDRGNILVDHASTGKFADLTILTFSPDVVVYFLQEIDQAGINTLALLSSFPDLSTILVGEDAVMKNLPTDTVLPARCLAVSNVLPDAQLYTLLNTTYSGE